MPRDPLRVLVVTLVLHTTGSVFAQVPRNPPPNQPRPKAETAGQSAGPSAATSGRFLEIPGLAPLRMESVNREIGLTPEQKRKLKAISDGLAASFQQFRELPQEEQQAREKNLSGQFRDAQRRAKAILTPRQLQAVEKIAFQLSAAGALTDPRLQEKLGLSLEQQRRLTTVYEQAGEKMQQLQRETATQVMQLLDDEQSAALKKQLDTPLRQIDTQQQRR
jgi:hypothetical protein